MKKQKYNDSGASMNSAGGILTKYEIEKYELIKRFEKPGEFKTANSENIQATTYDLSIGETHFIYNEKGWEKIYIGNDDIASKNFESDGFKRQNEMQPTQLRIDPFCSALIQLDEIVDTFSVCDKRNLLISGRFDLKLKMVSHGLISQQATQVEPFYKGRLFCYVHNLSSTPYKIGLREPFATIEFLYVSSTIDDSKRYELINYLRGRNNEKYDKKYCLKENDKNENSVNLGIEDIRFFLFSKNNNLPDHFGISPLLKNSIDKYFKKNINLISKEIEKKLNLNLKIVSAIVSSILALILSIIIPLLVNNPSKKDNSLSKSEIEMQIQVLKEGKLGGIMEEEVK